MSLNKEVSNIQNSALGAYLIWSFSIGYDGDIPFILYFLVLPMLYRSKISETIQGTRSGLRAFEHKLDDDCILEIHQLADSMKQLTLDSIRIASSAKLISINPEGYGVCLTTSGHKIDHSSIRQLELRARKLGDWFSELSLFEISTILKVRF